MKGFGPSLFTVAIVILLSKVHPFAAPRAVFFRTPIALVQSNQRYHPKNTQIFMTENNNDSSPASSSSEDKTESKMQASSGEELSSPSSSSSSLFDKIGSTTSAVVAGTFYLVLAWKRDALMVSFFIGSISNGILSKVLKKVLKQGRPAELVETSLDLPPSDNGMPSSHAMSLGFIGTFTALQLPWTTIPILLYVLISLVYRVKTNLHTVEQILVGVTLGGCNGYVWRSLCMGANPLGINVMDWVSLHFLNDQGLLPWYGLAIPALVGAAVVGSIERRISRFLDQRIEKKAD